MPKKATDVAAKAVVFTLDAPEGVEGEKITFDLSQVNEETLVRLALHGASQKIGDSYAGAKESGTDPVAYAKEAINDTIRQLYEGKWSVTRTGSGAPRVTILVQAFASVKGISLEEAQDVIGGLNDEEKKVVSANKKVAAKIAALRAEAAAEKARKAAEAAEAEDAGAAA